MCSGIYLLLPLSIRDLPVISESFPSSGRNGYPLHRANRAETSASCHLALPTPPAFTLANSHEPLETKIWLAFSCLMVLTSRNIPLIQQDCLHSSHSSGLLGNVLREAPVDSPVKAFTRPISSAALISIFMGQSSLFHICFLFPQLQYTLNILIKHQYTPGAHSRLCEYILHCEHLTW